MTTPRKEMGEPTPYYSTKWRDFDKVFLEQIEFNRSGSATSRARQEAGLRLDCPTPLRSWLVACRYIRTGTALARRGKDAIAPEMSHKMG